ncbi:HupE/UreJ family protein [Ruegeria arenilitoris]|uniref:HupE/UreJ family protein n=1 Tax=Ruegeria arenilitoris TaxID=1173585 RepID=UPI00147DC65A|nr:HupE/UreJ family protein [Ruegeria arenilitoris]
MRHQLVRLTILLVLAMTFVGTSALAHFKLNQNVRIFHVVHGLDATDVYIRTPMAYLVADKLGPVGPDGLPAPAPFTINRVEDGVLMHLVDADMFRKERLNLADILADDLVFAVDERRLIPATVMANAYPIGTEPGFATKDEATLALSGPKTFSPSSEDVYVGDTVVDIHIRFVGKLDGTYEISMSANPELDGQDETANLVLDYRGDKIRTYRATGLLHSPIEISGAATSAAITFVIEGIRHIIEGIDHVLFVLCMVIGAATLPALLLRVTGFTLGHTVTLIAGFFGFAPSAPWFIPAVETAIALTIILAAADAVFQRPERAQSNTAAVTVTAAIGLLHGFGFSFMLRNILQVDATNVWQSLLAFNLGVELGQLFIVAMVWPLVVFLRRMPPKVWIGARGVVAVSVSVIAMIWAFERISGVFA